MADPRWGTEKRRVTSHEVANNKENLILQILQMAIRALSDIVFLNDVILFGEQKMNRRYS